MDREHNGTYDDELRAAAFVTFLEQCELATQRWHLPLAGATIATIARTCRCGRDCARGILLAWGGRAWPARERVLATIWRTLVCRWTTAHTRARLVALCRAPFASQWVAPIAINACIWYILVFTNDDTELAVRIVANKSPHMRLKPRPTRSRHGIYCAEVVVPAPMISPLCHIEFTTGAAAVTQVFARVTHIPAERADACLLHNALAVWLMEYHVISYCDGDDYVIRCHWRDILAARYRLLQARRDYLIATGRGDPDGAPMRAWQACDTRLKDTGSLHDVACGACARYFR